MSRFYNTLLLLYIATSKICSVYGVISETCSEYFDPSICSYFVSCHHRFDFGNRYNYQYGARNLDVQENICDFIDIEARYYPIFLSYKKDTNMELPYNADNSNSIPPNDEILSLIRGMNLSKNEYEEIPNLQRMDNLAVLILSKNLLKVAKLSNIYELPELTEIDLSHNNISDVTYESDQHVYRKLNKIDLSYNNLIKISKTELNPFEKLDNLTFLDLSHNYLTLDSDTFEGTKKLLYLNISFNRISDINSSLFRFTELKLLDLSNNKINNITEANFEHLRNLEILDLRHNFISVIERESFQNMLSLQSLYLNNNKLVNMVKEIFKNVERLVNIDLSSNHLISLPRGLLKNKNIRQFEIKNNVLGGSLVKGTFEGLKFVTKLDISYQNLETIDNYAFNGLTNIEILLLNDNKIHKLASKCFRTIHSLKQLDLSNNKIEQIEFEQDDLINLVFLSLKNNLLSFVRREDFNDLNFLQFLDLSDNKISHIETDSFISLRELINFEISNNALSGNLEKRTFDGLESLPSLDISYTLISNVKNGSFIGMIQLKTVNFSHSEINTLEYNTFIHTGAIESLDLSCNKLKEFYINNTELLKLKTLYLNNNLLQTLDFITFQKYTNLEDLHLAHNSIQDINANIFTNMKQMRLLDISYNTNLKFNILWIEKLNEMYVCDLSGVKTDVSFGNIKDVRLSQLTISNSSITDVQTLQFNKLHHLNLLSLSCNEITRLKAGDFFNLSILKNLDVSHNKISYIQPGVFKDNVMLHTLNLSHNFLTTISFGIFHGIKYLQKLDISYNNINDLRNEKFYEVSSLNELIADHNKIESIKVEEFHGMNLSLLSIGDNPLPCDDLINFERLREVDSDYQILVTAIKLDRNVENFKGVTCNKNLHTLDSTVNMKTRITDDNAVLFSIRDILLNHFNNNPTTSTNNPIEKYFVNVTDIIKKSTSDITNNISSFMNEAVKNNETNILLANILKSLRSSSTTIPQIQITKDNATYDNLFLYVNRVKQELEEVIKLEKTNILNEIENKPLEQTSSMNHIIMAATEMSHREKFIASSDTKPVFTETCVALILIILVGFILFKVYKSRMFLKKRLPVNTSELPYSIDSSM